MLVEKTISNVFLSDIEVTTPGQGVSGDGARLTRTGDERRHSLFCGRKEIPWGADSDRL
jgi:hypothetical protein